MKAIKILLILFSVILIVSCNRDNNEESVQNPDVLTGTYTLRHFSPGFGPQETYNPNDIIWQFLPGKSLKVIVNTTTIPTNSQMPYTTSTTATYTLTGNNKVTIKEVVYDISFIDGKLILNADASADGKLISLTKIEI